MGRLIASLLLIGALTLGFSYLTADPFGATTRTSIQSQSAVEVAQHEANAAIQVAQWQAQAQIESAHLAAEADKVSAQERRRSSETWASTLPLLVLIMSVAGAIWIVLIYRGRTLLALAQQGIFLEHVSTGQSRSLLKNEDNRTTPAEQTLTRYAAQNNQRVLKQNGRFLLVDKRTDQVVKQLVRKG